MCRDGWGGGPRANRCPRVLTSSRVLAASARRPSRVWRRARPVKTKTKPFRVALRAACTLKTPQGKRGSGYRRGKERFKSSLSATARGKGGCGRGMPQKTADSGNTESASRWRPILASQCDLHVTRIAAQWWAASSFFPPSVARGTTCRRPALVLHLRDARRRHDNQCSCEVSSLPFAYDKGLPLASFCILHGAALPPFCIPSSSTSPETPGPQSPTPTANLYT